MARRGSTRAWEGREVGYLQVGAKEVADQYHRLRYQGGAGYDRTCVALAQVNDRTPLGACTGGVYVATLPPLCTHLVEMDTGGQVPLGNGWTLVYDAERTGGELRYEDGRVFDWDAPQADIGVRAETVDEMHSMLSATGEVTVQTRAGSGARVGSDVLTCESLRARS